MLQSIDLARILVVRPFRATGMRAGGPCIGSEGKSMAAGRTNWSNVIMVISLAILIAVEIFGVALASGWALAGLFELGHVVAYVLMGGNFENPLTGLGYMESNTMCDPHASEMVYRARAPIHRSVGCDVSNGLSMKREDVYARFGRHPVLAAVLPMADVYFSHGAPELFFHDSCAAASEALDGSSSSEKSIGGSLSALMRSPRSSSIWSNHAEGSAVPVPNRSASSATFLLMKAAVF